MAVAEGSLQTRKLRIGILAGEASGDILGAALLRALKEKFDYVEAVGIAGPLLQAEGCQSLFHMERLAVMGILEPLKRLPELLSIRKSLCEYFTAEPPDVFVGIDSPDFNLHLEYLLKKQGIPTVHMVSPSVWAWRKGRIKKIRASVDLMLTLFPFEASFYQREGVPVEFVGHPLAEQYGETQDICGAREQLGLPAQGTILGLLPGSRAGEVKLLAPVFLATARKYLEFEPDCQFVIAAANDSRYRQLEEIISDFEELPLTLISGQSQRVMTASDGLLMASGTATLEALLLKKPMVVAYKMALLSYAIISRMLTVEYVALPNLLAQRKLVPEFIQSAVEPSALALALLEQLTDTGKRMDLQSEFSIIHNQLRCNFGTRAAGVICETFSLS